MVSYILSSAMIILSMEDILETHVNRAFKEPILKHNDENLKRKVESKSLRKPFSNEHGKSLPVCELYTAVNVANSVTDHLVVLFRMNQNHPPALDRKMEQITTIRPAVQVDVRGSSQIVLIVIPKTDPISCSASLSW